MREIKFRAYDKKSGRIIDREYFQENPGDLNDYESDEWWDEVVKMELEGIEDLSKKDNFVVMQFTGLKDKTGKEIYEGDILEFWIANRNGEWKIKRQVKYVICAYGFPVPEKGFCIVSDYNMNSVVIGNIHQDSHLLDNNS